MAPKPDQALEAAMLGTAPSPTPEPAPAPAINPDVLALAKALAMEMMAGQRQINEELVDRQADAYAGAMKTAMKPENASPPLMSDFNPKGDRDFPRPALQCAFTMGSAEMPPELLTVEEIELLNQITPGHYRITKADDSQVTVSVVPTYDGASGAITKMALIAPFGGKHNPQDKDNWPPLRVWLAEALGVPPPQRPIERQPTGRINAPLLNNPRGSTGIVTSALDTQMANLGPMRGAVESMLGRKSDAMEPSLA
jgi:hypothetical protein